MARSAKLKRFYNSDKWVNFRLSTIAQRTNSKGELICEYCHKPITDINSAILHHKKELDDNNVDDVMISLNPSMVMVIHQQCHNKIHNRFCKVEHGVFLIYGAPFAGKKTYVADNKQRGDLVVDIDKLYEAISMQTLYDKPDNLFYNAIGLRNYLIDNIKTRYGKWNSAYIIGGYADCHKRNTILQETGATPVFIDTSKEECIQRLEITTDIRQYNKKAWRGYIEEWFDKYTT